MPSSVRVFLKYSAVLTGLYIIAANASGLGTVVTNGANGAATFEKTLQGRS